MNLNYLHYVDSLVVIYYNIILTIWSNFMGNKNPIIGIIMGSDSDWPIMQLTSKTLDEFEVPHECQIVSAHRTPDWMFQYAENAKKNGLKFIIAGAGGSAHLPGIIASKTDIPVLGVPIPTKELNGIDSLLSINQMPKGIPVATFAIGEPGAINSALFAVSMLANEDKDIEKKLLNFRKSQTEKVIKAKLK